MQDRETKPKNPNCKDLKHFQFKLTLPHPGLLVIIAMTNLELQEGYSKSNKDYDQLNPPQVHKFYKKSTIIFLNV